MENLIKALVEFNKDFPDVPKNCTAKVKGQTPKGVSYEFEYKYADLASILKAVRPGLTKNGLVISQFTRHIDQGKIKIHTKLMHISGESIENEFDVPCNTNDIQKMGSGITYGRRYEINSILGLCPEDDLDGAGSGDDKKEKKTKPPPPPSKPPPPQYPEPDPNKAIDALRGCKSSAAYTALVQGFEKKYGKNVWGKLTGIEDKTYKVIFEEYSEIIAKKGINELLP